MEINVIPKFVDNALGAPAQSVGNTLSNIWELAIGSHTSLWIKKQEIRQQQNLQDYIKKVEEKTQSIPEENLSEPPMHIVGPAIEASKYYIDSEDLREMFANLIASSVDNRKTDITHPSFVEIIKQMSPLDASLLMEIKSVDRLPIAQIKLTDQEKGSILHQNHVVNFLTAKNQYKNLASSLSNLYRLGLINIDYSLFLTAEDSYNYIEMHPAYKEAIEKIKILYPNRFVDNQKGVFEKTPLCEDFVKVCLS
ncbi:DUF4393 domain-containing protein [Rossellomorea marisflavi]|uniref:DUF4393 domain-containing protein n=1 Tax=Rossellomorea marisflavi TaxID=189381 RepID=UPI003D2F4C7E